MHAGKKYARRTQCFKFQNIEENESCVFLIYIHVYFDGKHLATFCCNLLVAVELCCLPGWQIFSQILPEISKHDTLCLCYKPTSSVLLSSPIFCMRVVFVLIMQQRSTKTQKRLFCYCCSLWKVTILTKLWTLTSSPLL